MLNLISWFDIHVESDKFEYLSMSVLLCVLNISNDWSNVKIFDIWGIHQVSVSRIRNINKIIGFFIVKYDCKNLLNILYKST